MVSFTCRVIKMSEAEGICKFCNNPVGWEDLADHMIGLHREKVIELFGTQIDDALRDIIYDHFEDLTK